MLRERSQSLNLDALGSFFVAGMATHLGEGSRLRRRALRLSSPSQDYRGPGRAEDDVRSDLLSLDHRTRAASRSQNP